MAFERSRGLSAGVFACAAALAASFVGHAEAGTILSENFDTLPTGAGGWTVANNSAPPGSTSWFQGDGSIIAAQQGASNSYAAANFNNAGFGGNVSDWLITPVVALANGAVLTFYTRTEVGGSPFADDLQVRLSDNGASTDVGATDSSIGDFTTLLLDINPTQAAGVYPEGWTLYSLTLSGLPGSVSGRLAFRYLVSDTNVSGDYIGLDTVSLVSQTPLPAALPLFASALTLLGFVGWRERASRS
jgi:hypothetical protein